MVLLTLTAILFSLKYMACKGVILLTEIVVAIIALFGTMLGTFGGILTSSKLTNYRIQQLENKVEKHNNFAVKIPVMQNDIDDCKRRIAHLESYHEEKV